MNVFVEKSIAPLSGERRRSARMAASRRARRELTAFREAARWLFGFGR
jgi:hypothetical protein